MPKYYVQPYNPIRGLIHLAIKAPINPRTGLANYLGGLPNLIGGNDDGDDAETTIKREALEETHHKLAITSIDATPIFHADLGHVQMDFFVAIMFEYQSRAALPVNVQLAMNAANAAWPGYPGHGRNCGCGTCVNYRAYLNAHDVGLTYLENTGEVGVLRLSQIDLTSDRHAADSIVAHTRTTNGYALAASSHDYQTSHTVTAIRLLASWARYTTAAASAAVAFWEIYPTILVNIGPRLAQGSNEEKIDKMRRAAEITAMREQMIAQHILPLRPPLGSAADDFVRAIANVTNAKTVFEGYRLTRTVAGFMPALPIPAGFTKTIVDAAVWMFNNQPLIV